MSLLSGTKNREFRVLLKYEMGDKKILGSCKLDAVDQDKFDEDFKDLEGFVELMTTHEKYHGKMHRNKARDMWAQNYLVGVPRLVCGYRTNNGVVRTIKCFQMNDLRVQFNSLVSNMYNYC